MEPVEWEELAFEGALLGLKIRGKIDGSGKRITPTQLGRILEATPHEAGRPSLKRANFRNACFDGDVSFQSVHFEREAVFDGAEFNGKADFHDVEFQDWAMFANATFHCDANFSEACFLGHAVFPNTRFLDGARAIFDAARFSLDANFNGTAFWNAQFTSAEFSGGVLSAGASFAGDALLTDAAFRAPVVLGPMRLGRRLVLDGAIFEEDGQIRVSAAVLSCVRTRFVGRADLQLRRSEIVLDDALFLQRSWLTGAHHDLLLEDVATQHDERPRLLSLRDANVANLSLSGVDLRACRFSRAQGLDQLRLEADCEFAGAPDSWRHTKRRTLAEEHHWRSLQHAGADDWHPSECRPPTWLDEGDRAVEVLDPPRIAALYRSLRKALEDSKDEPGAGSFYYGEMEMRRQRTSTEANAHRGRRRSAAERGIVSAYWMLSGYGLRASRAIGALLVVAAVSTAAFHLYGFQDRVRPYAARAQLQPQTRVGFPPSPRKVFEGWKSFEAWTYVVGTATAIVGAPDAQLTQTGRALRIVLRVLGPLLIGLALLAIRGRVKR